MKELLKEISADSINFYIEQNLDNFYTKSSEHPNFISHIENKISWVFARNADWPECIFRVNFENLNLENEIKNVEKLIRKKKAPNGWTLGPLTIPKNLGDSLEKYGFSNVYQQAGMAVELKNIEDRKIDEPNGTKVILKRIKLERAIPKKRFFLSMAKVILPLLFRTKSHPCPTLCILKKHFNH